MEVVAENYHNIWAKKKKNELITKGSEVQSSLPGRVHFLAAVLPLCILNLIVVSRRRDPPPAGSL